MENYYLGRKAVSSLGYEGILDHHQISHVIDGYYFVCGDPTEATTPRIYVSVIVSQIESLLQRLIPIFHSWNIRFAMVKDEQSGVAILNGIAGHNHVGKVFIVSLPKNSVSFIEEISSILQDFNGPVVPGKKLLSKNIYTNESTEQNYRAKFTTHILGGKYLTTSSLKNDPKGEVLIGYCFTSYGLPRRCVIKEGKQFMISDAAGRDMSHRLKWQKEIHNRLKGIVLMPKIVDLFVENGNSFLVMEKVKGISIGKVIENIYQGRPWPSLAMKGRGQLLSLAIEILEIVERVHLHGLLHRDLSSANFLLDNKGRLYLIDWELAFDLRLQYPLPPFGFGTPGFISPEQNQGHTPSVKEDIYGLSALMISFFTGLKPRELKLEEKQNIKDFMIANTGEEKLSCLISLGLDADPNCRPSLAQLKECVKDIYYSYTPNTNASHT